AEVVPRSNGAEDHALLRDRGLAGVDEEERGPSGAFQDHGLALLEAPLLQQACDLLGLSPVHACEQRHALQGRHRVARRRAWRRVAARLPRGDRAALEEVQGVVLDRPLDVAPRAVDLLALEGEVRERRQVRVVEAEGAHLLGRDLLLERAPVRERPDCDALSPGLSLQNLARAVETEVVGDDEARDHRLAEPPARLDEALVGAGHRVLGEHHAGDRGVEERLDDDADAGTREEADLLAVRDGRVGVRGPPHAADRVGYVARRVDVEERDVLPREARRGAVLVDRRGAHGERRPERADRLRHPLDRGTVPGCDGLHEVARESHAGRHRQSVARRVAEAHRLRAVERGLARLREGDDLLHTRSVTSPASPSTRIRAPSAMRSVASRVPTTPGMPYSRDTIAACERRPPLSVTIPPRSGRRMLKASVVDSVTRTSPLTILPNSDGLETRRAGPS